MPCEPTFKFNIGDFVTSKNGALIGLVQERFYHDYPAGVRVKYCVYGVTTHNGVRFGSMTLYEELEQNLDAAVEPNDWSISWKPKGNQQ